MEFRTRLMQINSEEQAKYLFSLRSVYGDEIIRDDVSIETSHQRLWEKRRHQLNAWAQSELEVDRSPRRLLLSVTQRCTLACSHCWVFGSPTANCSLSLDELDAIHKNTSAVHAPRWTVSGGEFFTLPYFAEALKRYPIDCTFSNGFWGYPKERCRRYVDRIAVSLSANRYIREEMLTLILSYDIYHVDACNNDLPLAEAVVNIITELYEVLPRVNLRISHARSGPDDTSYWDLIRTLKRQGFAIAQTTRQDHNGNIANLSFLYQKPDGLAKELFIDTYPIAPIGRSLLDRHTSPSGLYTTSDTTASSPRARYQYALGPDGGVGLYQILYAPPVPYWLGDLIREPWEVIAHRVDRDPIAITLEEDGIAPILAFLDRYYPALMQTLAPGSQMNQQFLYLVLLDPERRLLLNAYLLQRAIERNRLTCKNADIPTRIRNVLDAANTGPRQSALRELYENQSRELIP